MIKVSTPVLVLTRQKTDALDEVEQSLRVEEILRKCKRSSRSQLCVTAKWLEERRKEDDGRKGIYGQLIMVQAAVVKDTLRHSNGESVEG